MPARPLKLKHVPVALALAAAGWIPLLNLLSADPDGLPRLAVLVVGAAVGAFCGALLAGSNAYYLHSERPATAVRHGLLFAPVGAVLLAAWMAIRA